MTSPDFGMGINAAQKEQLGGRPAADEYYARPVPHDLGNQLRNFAIGKCTVAVGRERRECAVIIQEQSARASSPNSLEEGTAHVLMYRDSHSQPRFQARRPRRQVPDETKAQSLKSELKLHAFAKKRESLPWIGIALAALTRTKGKPIAESAANLQPGAAPNLCATVTGRSLARISRARAVESTWE